MYICVKLKHIYIMKANELRIGNYVKTDIHGVGIVEAISGLTILYSRNYNSLDSDNFKPIPLTEDLIKNLCYLDVKIEDWGNVVNNEYENFNRYVFYNVLDGTSNLEIHAIHSNYGGVSNLEFCISIDKYERQGFLEIEYLHQLQNGVYFLTNNELTIK